MPCSHTAELRAAVSGGSSTLSLTTSSSTPAGSSTLTVTGASDSLSHSTTVTLVVTTSAPPHSPDFTLAVARSTQIATVGANVTYTLTAKAVSGFNGTILFTNGTLPTGVTVVFKSEFTLAGTSVNLTHSVTAKLTVNSSRGGTMPQFGHVFIVMGENSTYSRTYSSKMPYLTSLANQYGLATRYLADTHPSIGNYEASCRLYSHD